MLDTRTANGLSGKFNARSPRVFQVAGKNGIPLGATAVTGNVTAVNESNGWAFFVGPTPELRADDIRGQLHGRAAHRKWSDGRARPGWNAQRHIHLDERQYL